MLVPTNAQGGASGGSSSFTTRWGEPGQSFERLHIQNRTQRISAGELTHCLRLGYTQQSLNWSSAYQDRCLLQGDWNFSLNGIDFIRSLETGSNVDIWAIKIWNWVTLPELTCSIGSRADSQTLSSYGCPYKIISESFLSLSRVFCCNEYFAVQPEANKLKKNLLKKCSHHPAFLHLLNKNALFHMGVPQRQKEP